MIVQGKIKIVQSEIQAQTYILMIQSQTLLFSTFPQATQMHKLSPYSPGAGTLQYTTVLCHHSPRRIFLTLRQDPLYSRWKPLSIYVAPPLANSGQFIL